MAGRSGWRGRSWRIVLGLALVVAAGRFEAFAGPTSPVAPEAARWVSADALIYLEITNPPSLIERVTDERFQGLLSAIPPLKRALESGEYRKLKTVAEAVAEKLGTTWDKALRDLTAGGALFAVEEAASGQRPRAYLIVTPSDPALLKQAIAALIDLARQDAAQKGQPDPVKMGEYRGETGYAVGDGGYGVLKDRLVIFDRSETARLLVDRALDGLKSSLADDDGWKARRAGVKADALVWAHARMDRLRELDPKRFGGKADEKPSAGPILLFGGWIEAIRTASSVGASLSWTDSRLAAELVLPVASKGRGEALQGFFPPSGSGAPALLNPPGTVASLSLWRNLSAVWEARADLFRPEQVQNLAKLDTFAGQFFGGRDFGTGVLGALTSDWRLVVALQDDKALSPAPDVKLPAFALVVSLKPDDDDFAHRLTVAFQSFIGLYNLGAPQTKAPPLELGSETVDGVTIATSRFMAARPVPGDEATASKAPVHVRHNFSPSAVQVGDHYVISSSLGLARDLVKVLKSPAKAGEATLVAEADGERLGQLVERNRTRMVMQNMLDKGHDKEQAEREIGLLSTFLRYAGHARFWVRDGADATRARLEFTLGK